MKKRGNVIFKLFILTAVAVFSFYRVDPAAAMAAEPYTESVVEPETEDTPVSETEPAAEEVSAPDIEPVTEESMHPNAEPQLEAMPVLEPTAEEIPAPDIEPVTEESMHPNAEPQLEAMPVLEPAAEEIPAPDIEPVTEEGGQPKVEPEQSVSTGSELTAWLEAHKNTGGMVKLSSNVVLDKDYCFCPNGANMPDVLVDTDKYTITVTGEIEFFSDNNLSFSGQPEGGSIFYVAPEGMLSMEGIKVKSARGALWQEEGAGLVVSDCFVSGDIHYAVMPFVTYHDNFFCVVVERGQTMNDVLPGQINCTVNCQGQLFSNKQLSVVWNSEGTEEQQEQRRRFQMPGSFRDAASAETVFCTVVYNDYPLTFTDVKASASGGSYIFQGWFTVSEKSLPLKLTSEYSFDGKNWFPDEEKLVKDAHTGFNLVCQYEQRSGAAPSNIYIRLQGNNNGIRYFSNVLRYSTENLDTVEDIGGSRGGGISIVRPPVEPVSPETEEPEQSTGDDTPPGNTELQGGSSDIKQTQNGGRDSQQTETAAEASYAEYVGTDAGQLPNVDSSNADKEPHLQEVVPNTDEDHIDKDQPSDAAYSNTGEKQVIYAESNVTDIAGLDRDDADISESGQENLAVVSVNESSKAGEQALHADTRQGSHIIIAAGFVLLSAVGGMVGFYVHSRLGTNR